MENRRVKIKKVVVCKDPARKSAWRVNMNPPIDQEQFEIIDRIIHSLRNILDSYLTVDLATPLNNMTYFQVRKDNENLWRVELHFEQPDIFSYKRDGKIYIRKHPWMQKKLYVHRIEDVISIFQEVLCENHLPDLTRWKNCTKEIYMERFKQKKHS